MVKYTCSHAHLAQHKSFQYTSSTQAHVSTARRASPGNPVGALASSSTCSQAKEGNNTGATQAPPARTGRVGQKKTWSKWNGDANTMTKLQTSITVSTPCLSPAQSQPNILVKSEAPGYKPGQHQTGWAVGARGTPPNVPQGNATGNAHLEHITRAGSCKASPHAPHGGNHHRAKPNRTDQSSTKAPGRQQPSKKASAEMLVKKSYTLTAKSSHGRPAQRLRPRHASVASVSCCPASPKPINSPCVESQAMAQR